MPQSLSVSRRIATAARWPAGVLITAWDYLWRTTPMHRTEGGGSVPDDLPPNLPTGMDLSDLQTLADGVGPLMHRTYVIGVRDADLTAAQLIDEFACQPDRASPTALARFLKRHGEEGDLRVDDEFTVRMPGPWDGPVRVIDVDSHGFTLATLPGHLEAGQIQFAARDLAPGRVEMRIESWARGGDRLSNLLFDRVPINKEVQLHMWTSVLERLVRMSGGKRDTPIHVTTRRVEAAQLARA